jgi:4-hydroxythreonine-4-phosphate dehydrogenase
MKVSNILPLAISMGEPAGIGPDLILQLYAKKNRFHLPNFIVYGNVDFLKSRAKGLGLNIDIIASAPNKVARDFAEALPVFDIAGICKDTPSIVQRQSASLVIRALEKAVADIESGKCRALITAPIHKAALYDVGFKHEGHTQFLASLCEDNGKTPTPVMMLAHEKYRTVPLTIHVPLKDVPKLVTFDRIIEIATITSNDLKKYFDISKPKIAICGLNPHAGEDSSIGVEDHNIIAPAIEQLQKLGINAFGPLAADTVFHPPHWAQYDCVIGMYHDQALIPIKTLAFDSGVNITLGLPFIRTSPDHGTAFDLAGSGKASSNSMLVAIRQADEMSKK